MRWICCILVAVALVVMFFVGVKNPQTKGPEKAPPPISLGRPVNLVAQQLPVVSEVAPRSAKLNAQERYDADLDARVKAWDREGTKDETQYFRPWLQTARAEMARRQKEVAATPPTFALDALAYAGGRVAFSTDGKLLATRTERGQQSVWELSQAAMLPSKVGGEKFAWPVLAKTTMKIVESGRKIQLVNGLKTFDLSPRSSVKLDLHWNFSTDGKFLVVGEGDGPVVLYRTADGQKIWSARYGTGVILKRTGSHDGAELRLSGWWLSDVDVAHKDGVIAVAAYGHDQNPANEGRYDPTGSVKVWVIADPKK